MKTIGGSAILTMTFNSISGITNNRKYNTTQSTAISTPRKTGFRKTLSLLERQVHVVAERELNPKLRMEEEEEEEEGKFSREMQKIRN